MNKVIGRRDNFKQSNFRIVKIILIILVSFGVSGCSTYPNRFKCGDAKGLGCTMLHEVDMQIDSGQIEEAYKDKNKNCRGKYCASASSTEVLNLKKRDKADSYPDKPEEHLDDNYNLHF